MPITNDNLNKKLYQLLKVQGFDPVPKDSKGETTPVPDEAEVFRFTFKVDGKPVGPAWVTVDSNQDLKVYYDDETMGAVNEDGGEGRIDDFTEFLQQLKQWAQRRQLGFDVENQDHLESDMAQREYMKNKERISEGYYPMGKSASYNDSVPSVKIILQHTRQIQEGEQRFRNIAKIFLENTVGERILAPTTRPGIAKVYARHLAEGGLPHDDRWNHIGSLVEEYTKMAGFVRATRGNQFNESAQQLVNEGINHYQSLRETLSRMIGHKGYHAYFESYTPALMEDETDNDTLNELFVQETMDPRIESVMPILSRLQKKVNEMSEVKELEEWANNLLEAPGAETLAHNEKTATNNLKAFGLAEDDAEDASKKIQIPAAQRKEKGGDWKVSTKDLEKAKEKNISGPEGIKALHKRLQQADEGIGDVAKKVGGALKKGAKAVGKAIVGPDDEELLRDLKKRAGVRNPQTGKPSMAYSDVEKVDEVDLGQYDAVKSPLKGKDTSDWDKNFREKLKQYTKELDQRQKENKKKVEKGDEQDVAEDLDANQKRVGQLGPTEKVGKKGPVGKLVGANESIQSGKKNTINEDWRSEIQDIDDWANAVREKLKAIPPAQRLSMAQKLSQIENKNFGSELTDRPSYNPQTGKPDPNRTLKNLSNVVYEVYRDLMKVTGPTAGGFGSATVDQSAMNAAQQAQQDASMANHYQQHIDDYALMANDDFMPWFEKAKESLLANPSDDNARRLSSDQVKRFGSKLIGQIEPHRAGYRDAYYTPQVKNILDNDVALMYEIERRQNRNFEEFMDNIEAWRKNWNKVSDKNKEKLANMTGKTIEDLEEYIAGGSFDQARPDANENFINTDAQAVVTEMDKDHKEEVKEGQEDLDAILRIVQK